MTQDPRTPPAKAAPPAAATPLDAGTELVPAARLERVGKGKALVLSLRGEIDLHNSPELREAVLSLLAEHAPERVVLNLANVPYMDSSAIAVLVEAMQKLHKTGGKVYVTDLQPRVKGLIEIARLNTIFVVCKDEAAALAK